MAVVLVTYKLTDAEGTQFSMPMHYDAAEVNTVAEAQGIATDMSPLISAVSGCAVVGAEVAFPLTVPAGDTADAGYRGDAGATLSFYNTASRAESIYVPGFLLSRLSGGVVEQSAADVGNFINAISTGGGITGGFIATDGNGLKLTAYRRGIQSTRKTRR